MNLQQLEYLVAVDETRHFIKAAEKCFVTQPTLSMMLQKLEDELGTKIFDRSRQPVEPTPDGIEIIKRAKVILGEIYRLKEFAQEIKNEVGGSIKLAVIPTLAPYIIPYFIQEIIIKYPKLKLTVKELATHQIIEALKTNEIDLGLLATPLYEPMLKEHPLFYEEFFAYTSELNMNKDKNYILPSDIDPNRLWLLEEGHCFRNQVLNFCNLRKKENFISHVQYEAGSIETLINLVDRNKGITIVPHLATLRLSHEQKRKIKTFADPKPVREISLVSNINFARARIVEALKEEILQNLPIQTLGNKNIVEIK